MIFADPIHLAALLIVPLWLGLYLFKRGARRGAGAVYYPDVHVFDGVKPGWRVRGASILPWVTLLALILMIVALARPRLGIKQTLIRKEGVDIILVMDISTSMMTEDFQSQGKPISRLAALSTVAGQFIQNRPNDRIGAVVFSGRPYILAPLSWDHDWLITRLKDLHPRLIEDSGTAIGAALVSAVNRLQESPAQSKVVILMTDGMNNAGLVTPEAAAKALQERGIILYTIGAGSKGIANVAVVDAAGQIRFEKQVADIDESMMTKIAGMTGGRYFRADNTRTLNQIFEQINRMAKTSQDAPVYGEYRELYPYFLGIALLLLVFEAMLARTVFRRMP